MRKMVKAIVVLAAGFSGMAFAAEPTCTVYDAKDNALAPTSSTRELAGGVLTLSASSDVYSYTLTLEGAEAKVELTDKRSGDKATLGEGDLAAGEKIVLGLVTDEAPDSPLKLVCENPAQ